MDQRLKEHLLEFLNHISTKPDGFYFNGYIWREACGLEVSIREMYPDEEPSPATKTTTEINDYL